MPAPLDALCMSYLAYELPNTASNSTLENTALDEIFDVQPQGKMSDGIFAAYPRSLTGKIGKIHYLTRKGWLYFSFERNEMAGYQCVVFINHATKELVLSHRGTVSPVQTTAFQANAKCDAQILSGNHAELTPELRNLLSDLLSFITQIVRKKSDRHPDYTIWQTGHSLGGFLAEFGAAYLSDPRSLPGDNDGESSVDNINKKFKEMCESEGRNYSGHPFRLHKPRINDSNSMAFDSLGSINILNKLGISSGNANSEHYFLEPNIANTANLHDGTRYILLNHERNFFKYHESGHSSSLSMNETHGIDELSLTASSHSLDNMLLKFNQNTGEADNRKVITEWPTAINTFIRGDLPKRSSEKTFDAWVTNFAVSMAHTTDNIISFKHERNGNVNYENKEYDNKCPIS